MSKTTDPKSPSKRSETDSDAPLKRKRVAGVAKAAKEAVGSELEGERIAKAMARAGLCSRREAETWIADGRVSVNGKVLDTPAVTVSAKDRIVVDGQPMPLKERTRLFLYHKPRGLVTTTHDPEGRPTVFERLPEDMPRVVTVGRLDINTEGLLLLTNDGGLARVLELPSTGWLRRYRVRAFGTVTQGQLDSLKEGVTIEGISYGSVEATIDTVKGSNVWLVVGLREGKNREVKRILQHLGLTVNRLIRVSFGPFQLADLGEGEIREIRGKVLRDQLGQRLVDESGADFEAPIIHHIAGAENEGVKPTKAPSAKDEPKPKIGRSKLEFIGTDEDGSRRARIDREGRPSVAVKILPKRETARSGPARSRPQRGGSDEVAREERGAKPFRSEGFRDRGPGQGPARGRDRGAEGEGGGRNWRSEGARDHGATSAPRKPRREASEAQSGDEVRAPRGRKPFGDKPFGDRPVRNAERSDRPARGGERSDRPARTGDRSERPVRGGDRDARPAREDFAPRGRGRPSDGEGKRGPVKSGDRGDRPVRSGGDRNDRPPRSGDRSDRPAGGGDRSAKPARGGDRTDRPARSGDRPVRGGKPGGPGKPAGGGGRGPRGGGSGNGADRRR